MAECVFCGIASRHIPSQVVGENDTFFAFSDTRPQAPTHVLIVPKRHLGSLSELSQSDAELAGQFVLFGAELARRLGVEGRGYRLVLNTGSDAGQSVAHLHVHLLAGRTLGWPPG